jgi:hypothetical protein
MAKQRTGGLSWRCLGNVWVAGLTWTLIAMFCPGEILRAAEGAPAGSSSSNATLVSLDYQETGYSVNNWSVSLKTQTSPFKKEPGALSGKIVRGVLNFAGESSNAMRFLWQRDARKLYLDLNRNEDLTDDPSGVFLAGAAQPVTYQAFTNVHLDYNTASGRCRVLADLNFYDYGPPTGLMCTIAARSFWQGKVTLQGRDWQAGIVPTVWDASGFLQNSRLVLRPWEKRTEPFNTGDGLLASVPFPLSRKVFVDGHAYQMEWTARSENGEARPALQFVEQPAALGELKITGQYIGRLVLTGGPYLVVLDQPSGVVKVPTGSYNQLDIKLERNGTEAFRNAGQAQAVGRIAVNEKAPVVLNVGGPLTNTVRASRHGPDLRLDYLLAGAGGETYQMAKQDRSKPPGFAIYHGEKKMATGDFEYG